MYAKLHEATLTDNSKVYDVLIESAGMTLASIPCPDEAHARQLLKAIEDFSLVAVIG